MFPGISPGIWELDSWLEALEGGKWWKRERTGVGMKGKPESQFGRVCGGRRRPRDSGGEGEDGGLKGTEKGWCGGRKGDVGEEKRKGGDDGEVGSWENRLLLGESKPRARRGRANLREEQEKVSLRCD